MIGAFRICTWIGASSMFCRVFTTLGFSWKEYEMGKCPSLWEWMAVGVTDAFSWTSGAPSAIIYHSGKLAINLTLAIFRASPTPKNTWYPCLWLQLFNRIPDKCTGPEAANLHVQHVDLLGWQNLIPTWHNRWRETQRKEKKAGQAQRGKTCTVSLLWPTKPAYWWTRLLHPLGPASTGSSWHEHVLCSLYLYANPKESFS